MLAHELRNPLAAIRIAVESLEARGRRPRAWAEDVIARQVKHLTRLVDDLLDVSRITRGKIRAPQGASSTPARSSTGRSRRSARWSTSAAIGSRCRSPPGRSGWRPTRSAWSRSSSTS